MWRHNQVMQADSDSVSLGVFSRATSAFVLVYCIPWAAAGAKTGKCTDIDGVVLFAIPDHIIDCVDSRIHHQLQQLFHTDSCQLSCPARKTVLQARQSLSTVLGDLSAMACTLACTDTSLYIIASSASVLIWEQSYTDHNHTIDCQQGKYNHYFPRHRVCCSTYLNQALLCPDAQAS